MKTLLFISIFGISLSSYANESGQKIFFDPIGEELNISPNPASDNLVVNANPNTELYIFNVLGNKIATVKADNSETTISVSDYPNGVYVLKTSDGHSGRFVVKH